ncbi:MAG: hypothetical protein Q9167_006604 [Letrouitia subvulpina]
MSPPSSPSKDVEKASEKSIPPSQEVPASTLSIDPETGTGLTPTFDNKVGALIKRLERSLVKYNLEARGIQRVLPHESQPLTWRSYFQPFLLYFSINLAAQNVTLGMLGPVIFTLSFRDAALCSFFGALLGSIPVAYTATFGPRSGNRTLIFARYTFGWYPSKLLVILELIILIGYSMIDLVVAGQVLSATSINGNLSIVVGIIILAIITWFISTFGIAIFNVYSRYAFIPAIIAFSIVYGVTADKYDLSTPSQGDRRTVIGNSAAITYAGAGADFFVYYNTSTPPLYLSISLFLGLLASFTFTFILGVGLASAIPSVPSYSAAYETSQGALIVVPLLEQLNNGFARFLGVIIVLGLIANTVAPTYSSGIDLQILSNSFERVPRIFWNTVCVIIYTVCALAGRDHLAEIFTNFLSLMGYWCAIYIAITIEEQVFFRTAFGFRGRREWRGWGKGYDWSMWNQKEELPRGLAAMAAFLVGWAGAILCMAQVWYRGPIADRVGEYGADLLGKG